MRRASRTRIARPIHLFPHLLASVLVVPPRRISPSKPHTTSPRGPRPPAVQPGDLAASGQGGRSRIIAPATRRWPQESDLSAADTSPGLAYKMPKLITIPSPFHDPKILVYFWLFFFCEALLGAISNAFFFCSALNIYHARGLMARDPRWLSRSRCEHAIRAPDRTCSITRLLSAKSIVSWPPQLALEPLFLDIFIVLP